MPQVNDCLVNANILNGYGEQYNDGLLAWAQANGATSNQLNEALIQVAQANGATSNQWNDALFEMLVGLGYTGAFPDMWNQFWCVDGGQLAVNLFEPGDTWVGSGDWVDNGDGTWSITAPPVSTNLLNQDADARVTPLFPGDFDITFNILSSNGGNWRMFVGSNFVQSNAIGIVTSSYLGISRIGGNYGIQARIGTTMTVRIDTAQLINTGP